MKKISWWVLVALGAVVALVPQARAQFNPYTGGNVEVQPKSHQAKEFGAVSPGATATMSAPTSAPLGASLGAGSYRLGPEDIVEISVYGVPELSVTTKVGADGLIQLPLLGPTFASGKTAEQLQQEITARLAADYVQNPQVIVLVKEFNSRTVIVTGAIKNGVYPLKGETTLLQLIAGIGGFNDQSDSTVLIMRNSGGKRMAAKFDVSDIEKGRAPDPLLQAGDRILAGESAIKKTYGFALKALGLAGRFAIF